MNTAQIKERLAHLRRVEFEYYAQLHAVQGAIAELEEYWLPLLNGDDAMSEEELEQTIGGKIERE